MAERFSDRATTCEKCYVDTYNADLKKLAEHAKTCKDCKPDKACPKGLKFVDPAKYEIAYNRVANMSAKGDGREKTEWFQVVAICKTCRPKFEKSEYFVDWMEPSKK